jgi:hypothetical protein
VVTPPIPAKLDSTPSAQGTFISSGLRGLGVSAALGGGAAFRSGSGRSRFERQLFEHAGRALTLGRDWRNALATALGIRPDSIRHMSSGQAPIMVGHLQDLLTAVVARRRGTHPRRAGAAGAARRAIGGGKPALAENCSERPSYQQSHSLLRMLGGRIGRRAVNHAWSSKGRRIPPEYLVWQKMHRRCRARNEDNCKFYGGRGILVCERSATATVKLTATQRPFANAGRRQECPSSA